VLVSRSEAKRGQWTHLGSAPFSVEPVGSIAYRLACVAAGFADATWTLDPRHEWDVAAGVALVLAARGEVSAPDGSPLVFNLPVPRFEGIVAFSPRGRERFKALPPELSGCLEPQLGSAHAVR
jgi:myo-inositol-1(or 4)-monophosphatase